MLASYSRTSFCFLVSSRSLELVETVKFVLSSSTSFFKIGAEYFCLGGKQLIDDIVIIKLVADFDFKSCDEAESRSCLAGFFTVKFFDFLFIPCFLSGGGIFTFDAVFVCVVKIRQLLIS